MLITQDKVDRTSILEKAVKNENLTLKNIIFISSKLK